MQKKAEHGLCWNKKWEMQEDKHRKWVEYVGEFPPHSFWYSDRGEMCAFLGCTYALRSSLPRAVPLFITWPWNITISIFTFGDVFFKCCVCGLCGYQSSGLTPSLGFSEVAFLSGVVVNASSLLCTCRSMQEHEHLDKRRQMFHRDLLVDLWVICSRAKRMYNSKKKFQDKQYLPGLAMYQWLPYLHSTSHWGVTSEGSIPRCSPTQTLAWPFVAFTTVGSSCAL